MKKLMNLLEREMENTLLIFWIFFKKIQGQNLNLIPQSVLSYGTSSMGRNWRAEEEERMRIAAKEREKKTREAKMINQRDCMEGIKVDKINQNFIDWFNGIMTGEKSDHYFSNGWSEPIANEKVFHVFTHGQVMIVSENSALIISKIINGRSGRSFSGGEKIAHGISFVQMSTKGELTVSLVESLVVTGYETVCHFKSCKKKKGKFFVCVENNYGTKDVTIRT